MYKIWQRHWPPPKIANFLDYCATAIFNSIDFKLPVFNFPFY